MFFTYSNASANWQITNADTGSDTTADCGIARAADNTWQKLDIQYEAGVGVHYRVDNVECSNSPINADFADASGEEFAATVSSVK